MGHSDIFSGSRAWVGVSHLGNTFKNRGAWVFPPHRSRLPGQGVALRSPGFLGGPTPRGRPGSSRCPPVTPRSPARLTLSGRHRPWPVRQSKALLCHKLLPGRFGDPVQPPVQPTARDLDLCIGSQAAT